MYIYMYEYHNVSLVKNAVLPETYILVVATCKEGNDDFRHFGLSCC